jgi:5-methylcytosine-specific restriction endonuclease McrA
MKLTIELVPQTSWYSNVRSNVSKESWDIIRRKCYKAANYKCEICGETGLDQGFKHPVECHEIWEYGKHKKQILKGFISLCPLCHKTKHIGLARINGEEDLVIDQLIKVNKITRLQAVKYILDSFVDWGEKNKHDWELDISFIDDYLNI